MTNTVSEKECRGCKSTLPVSRFKKHGKSLDGYGIGLADYDELLQKQGGGCAICGLISTPPFSRQNKRSCNTSLGGFKDNPKILQKALDYLARH